MMARAVGLSEAAVRQRVQRLLDYVVIASGSYGLLLEVVAQDDESLLSLLNGKIRAIPGVRSTDTFISLKLIKQTYSWGTR